MDHDANRDTGAAQRLELLAAEAGLQRSWYAWCDAELDWALAAEATYEPDGLLTPSGGFAVLPTQEFLHAFALAGASASSGSSWLGTSHRSFTVGVTEGAVAVALAVRLGRGLNSMECLLSVQPDGEPRTAGVLLHVLARDILSARAEDVPDPSRPYPRPIIGSRSQLEVVARELVELMRHVARGWAS